MNLSPGSSDHDISIDLDQSVLHQVRKAIHRFAAAAQEEPEADEEDPIPQFQLSPPAKEQTLEEKTVDCEQQIKLLEAEIKLLEDELKRRDQPLDVVTDDQLEQAMISISQPDHSGAQLVDPPSSSVSVSATPSTDSDDQQLQALRSQIRLSESFSGVKFDNVSWEITQKDDSGLCRQHTHSGSAHGFSFQVVFVVREEKVSCCEEECLERARIIALRAKVDPDIRNEMQCFLKRASADCDLMNFYQTFVKCSQHVLERRTTLNKLKSRYGGRVSLVGGVNDTRMRYVFDSGCCLNLNWDVTVSDQGQVDHSVSLQMKSPANVSEATREGLSQLPNLLQKIMLTNGHSKGIMKFLSLLVDSSSHVSS